MESDEEMGIRQQITRSAADATLHPHREGRPSRVITCRANTVSIRLPDPCARRHDDSGADTARRHDAAPDGRLPHDPRTSHPSFPVVECDGRVLGIVDPPTVLRWRRGGQHRRTTLREFFAGTRSIVAHPDEYLDGVIERMTLANVVHILVVTRQAGTLVGYLGWKDLINVRARLQAEERGRVVLYRVR
jgi:hypothetical protein